MAGNEFANHCAELLSVMGTVRVTRMFGGRGLYVDELFIAIVVGDCLYLKTDEQSRGQFEAAGGGPFVYVARGREQATSYFTVPDEALESPALMQPWGRLAMEAALRTRNAASKRRRKTGIKTESVAAKKKRPRST